MSAGCRTVRTPAAAGTERPLILALFSGILLALSFPKFGQSWCGWVALMPLIVSIFDDRLVGTTANRRRGFLLGLVAGAGYFGGTVYWTGSVVQQFGGLAWPVAVFVGALLVAYLALFPALFGLLLARLAESFGPRAILLAPAVWVTTELARTYFWSGFPWVLLGYSQTTMLPVAQIASVVGVFGLSALVAFVSSALAFLVVARSRQSLAVLAGTVAAILGITLWGDARLARNELTKEGRPVRVALVQGNIPQDQKWDPAQASNILATYLRMTHEAAQRGAQLVIWPESSTPFFFEDDRVGGTLVRESVKRAGVELLLGSDQMERTQPPAYYNAAFMVRRDGQVAAVYRKMHLVPFGEFVPLKNLLFFVGPLVEAAGAFTPGQSMVLLPTAQGAISTAICYEIVYPALVRESVLKGSELLTTITNDAWYGHSSAPYQHFLQASMRAIEQGRYLARSANTGISGIVDPYGRVLQQSAIFERTVMVGEVRMLAGRTVYGKIGDVFAYACAAVALAALVQRRRHGPRDR